VAPAPLPLFSDRCSPAKRSGISGIAAVVWLNAALLAAAAFAALPLYRRVVLVAALILGSHAMHDSFAVIRWGAAGIGPGTAGLLWSLSVAAEVIVFLFLHRVPCRHSAIKKPKGCLPPSAALEGR
jgi:hypothetical protein